MRKTIGIDRRRFARILIAAGEPGSDDMPLLGSYSPSSDASVDITSVISSTYDRYKIVGRVTTDSDADLFQARTSTDNGSTWDQGASDYDSAVRSQPAGSASADGSYANAAQINLNRDNAGYQVGSAAGEDFEFEIWLHRGSATAEASVRMHAVHSNASGAATCIVQGGRRKSVGAINAFQLFFGSGTISGSVRIYGEPLS